MKATLTALLIIILFPGCQSAVVGPLPNKAGFSTEEAQYIQNLKGHILKKLSQLVDETDPDLLNAPEVKVQFQITEQGVIKAPEILAPHKLSELEMRLIKEAFILSSPYKPFPKTSTVHFKAQETFIITVMINER